MTVDSFTAFVQSVEPRLKRPLVAATGKDAGLDATAHSPAHGWEHWNEVRDMDNGPAVAGPEACLLGLRSSRSVTTVGGCVWFGGRKEESHAVHDHSGPHA